MNSYQTVNAAFAESGLTKQEAVAFGRAHEAGLHINVRSLFSQALAVEAMAQQLRAAGLPVFFVDETTDFSKLPFPNAPRVDHDPVGRWNAEDKERQLKLYGKSADVMIVDDIGPAAIPRRDYGVKATQEKYAVVQGTHRGEDVYWVARLSDLKRVTFYTTLYENATWWAEIRNNGEVTFTPVSEATDVMRKAVR